MPVQGRPPGSSSRRTLTLSGMVQCSCSVGSRPFLRARRIPSPPLPQGRCGPPADTGRRGPPTGTGPIRTTGSEGHRGRPDLCHAIASRRSLEVNGAESSRQPTHPPVLCRVGRVPFPTSVASVDDWPRTGWSSGQHLRPVTSPCSAGAEAPHQRRPPGHHVASLTGIGSRVPPQV